MQLSVKHEDILRFYKKIKYRRCGCWDWQGSTTTEKGGGQAGIPTFSFKQTKIYARRLAYLLCFNQEPQGFVRTTCGNNLCVSPLHLVCQHDKNKAIRKFTTKKRKKTGLKLIQTIARLYRSGFTQLEISKELKLNFSKVNLILKMIKLCRESKLPIKTPLSSKEEHGRSKNKV